MSKYTACICEGGAEQVILDMLHDNHIRISTNIFFKPCARRYCFV